VKEKIQIDKRLNSSAGGILKQAEVFTNIPLFDLADK